MIGRSCVCDGAARTSKFTLSANVSAIAGRARVGDMCSDHSALRAEVSRHRVVWPAGASLHRLLGRAARETVPGSFSEPLAPGPRARPYFAQIARLSFLAGLQPRGSAVVARLAATRNPPLQAFPTIAQTIAHAAAALSRDLKRIGRGEAAYTCTQAHGKAARSTGIAGGVSSSRDGSSHCLRADRYRRALERLRPTSGATARKERRMATYAVAAAPHSAAARPPRPFVLWAIALTGCAAAGSTVALALASEGTPQPVVRAITVDWIILPYVLAGLVAWWRRPESRFGPLMVAAGFGAFLSHLSWTSLALPSAIHVPYTIGLAFLLLPPVLFLHVFLAFPSGRLERSFERACEIRLCRHF